MKVICYLPYGFPTIEDSLNLAKTYIESGCDMLEISLPTDNAYIDPPHISDKMKSALEVCGDYDVYLSKLADFIKENKSVPIMFVAYEHVIAKIGFEKLQKFMLENGILDIIYVGEIKYPKEREEMMASGIQISAPITHLMEQEEIDGVLSANGCVYMEGAPTRGSNPNFGSLAKCISYLKDDLKITRPVYCGVGIHTAQDVTRVREANGDGVFLGTALLKLDGNKEAIVKLINAFRDAAK